MTDFRQEPFAQHVAFVIQNVPMLKAHVEARLARMYSVSALNEDCDRGKRQRTATNCAMFPGAIVCSLLRSDVRALTDPRNNYVALEKTDGVRYLLLLTTLEKIPYAILIDRKMEMRVVNLDFSFSLFEQEALFDGELAQNIENGLYTFLIFDLIYTGVRNQNGERLYKDTPYTQRMRQANHIVKTMWQKQVSTEAEYRVYSDGEQPQPSIRNTFSLKVKRYVPLPEFSETFKQVVEQNTWKHHGFRIDGFIFVRSRQPVEPFRNEQQFKYKPASLHTIDVQLFRTNGNSFDLLIKNTRNCPQLYSKLVVCPENDAFLAQYSEEIAKCEQSKLNFIVECSWSEQNHCWILKNPRFDKQTPNALNTVEQTKKNIQENIKLEELVERFQTLSQTSQQKSQTNDAATNLQMRNSNNFVLTTTTTTTTQQESTQPKGCFVHPSRLQNITSCSVATTKQLQPLNPLEYDPEQNIVCPKAKDEFKPVCEQQLSSIYRDHLINDCQSSCCVATAVPNFNLEDLEKLLFQTKSGSIKLS